MTSIKYWLMRVTNLIGDDIRTIERNTDMLINACKDIGLAANSKKIKYMEIGHDRGMIANKPIRINSNSYEKIKKKLEIFRFFSDKSTFY